MDTNEKESICLSCIYGAQPYGYYPIVCVQGKRIRDMYEDKKTCKHFEAYQEDNNELHELNE